MCLFTPWVHTNEVCEKRKVSQDGMPFRLLPDLKEDICWIVRHVPPTSRDWTELNWYLRTGRMFYRITFPDSLEDCAVLSESLSTSSEADVTTCSRRLMQLRGLPMCGRFLRSEVGGRKVADSSRCNKVRSGQRNLTRGTCGSSLINPSAYGSNGNVGYESWPRQKI